MTAILEFKGARVDNAQTRDVRHSAREAHTVLAEMAWEQLPPEAGLEIHVMTMFNILTDIEQYAELWRRVRERA